MEYNEAVVRSVSLPLLTLRVAQKRNISLSRAVKAGIAICLATDLSSEDLSEYEAILIQSSDVGRLKSKLISTIQQTMGQQKVMDYGKELQV